jgi:hypothetical protein
MADKSSLSVVPTGPVPPVRRAFFPLDRELELLPGSLAPRQQEHLVHLASCLPFEQAAHLLGDLLGVQVSAETARCITEQMGAWMEVAQLAETDLSAPPEMHACPEQPVLERGVLSVDGAMISLIHKQWVEVRTLAIGNLGNQTPPDGEAELHVGQLSYFSSLADASTFIELAAGEIRRRKVAQARQVCAVTDGAEWCQAVVDRHRPDAVRILDFPHAAEHLSALLEGCSQVGIPLPEQMLSRCLHVLKHRGPTALVRMAERLLASLAQHKGIQVQMEYLQKRTALMQYPHFQAEGWPIGSGMVESANKLVVQARLKGSGMHWERKNVNPLLALRLAVCNDRWAEMWKKTLVYRERQSVLVDPLAPPAQSPSRLLDSSRTPSSPALLAASASRSRVRAEDPHHPASVRPHAQRTSASHDAQKRTAAAPRRTLPEQIKHEVIKQLPRTRIQRLCPSHAPYQPFVKEHADRCPCGAPVAQDHQARGHRPRLYCSARCRMRAHRWRRSPWAPV